MCRLDRTSAGRGLVNAEESAAFAAYCDEVAGTIQYVERVACDQDAFLAGMRVKS